MISQLIENQTISANLPLKQALEKLNNVPDNLTLFVLNDEKQLVGTLTDGDVRRGLLNGLSLDDKSGNFMFHGFRYLKQHDFTLEQVRELRDKRIKMVPVLDENQRIVRFADLARTKSMLPVEAVIMAGGRGERLRPLTDTLPKPLLKVGDKPILEHNIDHLKSFGIDRFHIAINYLGEMISDYFGDGSSRDLKIDYIHEKRPLGTLGAAALINNFVYENILIMNADILSNIDLEDFFSDFEQQQALMSVASVPYKVNMPFAVLETNQSRVLSFREKPQYTYYTSGGIYLIKRSLTNRIPLETMYHATDLMDNLLSNEEKLIQYPISGMWMDIGRKEDFDKAQEEIKHLRF